jgi:hypothetical protein
VISPTNNSASYNFHFQSKRPHTNQSGAGVQLRRICNPAALQSKHVHTNPGQASTKGANLSFVRQYRWVVLCAKQNAGWLLWGTFFASFLWANKEMKVKNEIFYKLNEVKKVEFLFLFGQAKRKKLSN